jgi:hypothetical protein
VGLGACFDVIDGNDTLLLLTPRDVNATKSTGGLISVFERFQLDSEGIKLILMVIRESNLRRSKLLTGIITYVSFLCN